VALSNDTPISEPTEDLYGLDPFARAIAKSIERMDAPEGVVLAINGPWGAGKSSAINLIQHHLQPAIDNDELTLVTFNPWWFPGTDALTLSFFRELGVALGDTLSDKARKSLAAIGGGISALGPLLAAGTNLKAPGFGRVVGGAATLFGKLTKHTRTLDQEHKAVAEALRQQKKRFLVVIDDIDRLSPDDALTVFRLVKSVGRLPNVIYLLSFDRALAERAIAERFPSEGPSYLEKIVQGAFELPPPMPDVLRTELVNAAVAVMGDPPERLHVRFWNVFMDLLAPVIRTPRDVIRIVNDLKATWPAVAGEVDRTDFLALSALKLLAPEIYRAIRAHPDELCGAQPSGSRRGDDIQRRYDAMLAIDSLPDSERERWRTALRRLFPRLDSVWSNLFHSDDDDALRDRRLCARSHFHTYFAFSISEDILPAEKIGTLIARADDRGFIEGNLREALGRLRRDGSTQAALVLEELTVHAATVPEEKVTSLLSAVFALGDDLDVEADRKKGGFSIGDNQMRIHWLCNRLVTDRFPMERRDVIYWEAAQHASLSWLCALAERCQGYYEPRGEDRGPAQGTPLVSAAVSTQLVDLCLVRIRAAAADGSLASTARPYRLMFFWRHVSPGGADEVRAWTDAALANKAFVIAMADATTSVAWTQTMGFDGNGDRVSRPSVRVDFEHYRDMLDCDRLERRVDEVLLEELTDGERQVLDQFKSAPRGSHMRNTED
jgi:predicted KAP-like P-loop ATPase